MKNYQFGFDLHFFIVWVNVSQSRFFQKLGSLVALPRLDVDTRVVDILELFTGEFSVFRDGWRLYRVVAR